MILLNTIKRELDAIGIKPKKSLGQNFLVNEGVYKKIITALEIKRGDAIVEVGPGLGTLTKYLLQTGAKVIAVEKDKKLVAYLKNKFLNQKNVKIIEGDILKFSPVSCKLKTENYKLVGNIPYYLTSRLLRTVFEKWPQPEFVVLMIQKEVAQRIVAKPPHSNLSGGAGRPQMSLLAVSVQYYTKPEIVSYVSRHSFYPAPEVDSAIIKLEIRKQKIENRKNDKDFFRIVKTGFAGKRKQLINNLATGLKTSKQEIQKKLSLIGINPQRRAETLTVEEWQKITEVFF